MKAEEIKSRVAGARDLTEEAIEVPEWGVAMRVVLPSGKRKVAFDRAALDAEADNIERMARMTAAVLLDEENVAPFFDGEGWRTLYDKNPELLLRLWKVVERVCIATDAKIETAMGESEGGPSNDSDSASA